MDSPPAVARFARLWPLGLALLLLAAVTAWTLRASLRMTGGGLVYALDDPYIHMAIAKNVVRHGVWGTTPWAFTSATSSPIWTLLLAATYRLFGINVVSPLVLNLAFAAVFLLAVYGVLRHFPLSPTAIAALLFAEIICVPVVPVVMCGLEHFLQLDAAVLFVWLASRGDPARLSGRAFGQLCAAAIAVVAARYEGLFLVAGVVLLLAAGRRPGRAAALLAAAALPVVAYGIWSVGHGWAFLPASLHLKANVSAHGFSSPANVFRNWTRGLVRVPHLAIMLLGGALLIAGRQRERSQDPATRMMLLTLVAIVLHLSFALAGFFYRYEAYLVALWILSVGCLLAPRTETQPSGGPRLGRAATVARLLLALTGPLFVVRGLEALSSSPRACRSIFEQQIQMARFLNAFYAEHRVVANDVGAINFFTDLDNLDLVGLTTRDAMWAHLRNQFTRQRIGELAAARRMEIAIVYDDWYQRAGGLPTAWSRRGEWTIRDAVTTARPTVAFYAITPADVDRLDASLQAFAPRLPPTVIQAGSYLQAGSPDAPATSDRTLAPR
jgi:hypothetical protein